MNSKKLNNGVVEFVQNYFFMLILAIILFGFSAFKISETKNTPEDGWYEVIIATGGNPISPDDQLIGSKLPSAPPPAGQGCALANTSGHLCAVNLEFDTSDPDNQPLMPETLQDVLDDDLVENIGEARKIL